MDKETFVVLKLSNYFVDVFESNNNKINFNLTYFKNIFF